MEFKWRGISKYPIDPDIEQKVKRIYLKKIEWWNSPEGKLEKIKGVNVAYLRVVPLNGVIDENGFSKFIYRVYYGKNLYDEYTNDSHLCDINPNNQINSVCEFCQMPNDHLHCGYSCRNNGIFDKFLEKLLPKCPYS